MRGPGRRTGRVRAAAAAVACLVAAACDGDGGTSPAKTPARVEREYLLVLRGVPADLPFNRTLFLTTAANPGERPLGCVFFEDELGVRVLGCVGDPWRLRSEEAPTAAVERMLWMTDVEGRFGDSAEVEVPLTARSVVHVTGDPADGPTDDVLTVADTASPARLAAVRNSARGLSFAVWDETTWTQLSSVAPERPWAWRDSRAGDRVFAARTEGRQWVAVRATLGPDAPVFLDARAQPPGGGVVVVDRVPFAPGSKFGGCDLLLRGELAIPQLRLTQEHTRARWAGVPPGRHAVRFPDGSTVDVHVEDGREVRVGPPPK